MFFYYNFCILYSGDNIINFTYRKSDFIYSSSVLKQKFIKRLGFLLIFASLFLGGNVLPLFSAEQIDRITSIEVIGLSRTKPHIAEYPLERFLNLERSDFDENEVFAVIINTGILDPVSAELIESEDGLILMVTVREKWAFFPLPLVLTGSGGTSYGLFLIDSNAFGVRDIVALGGTYSSDGWSAMLMYNHTASSSGLPGWNSMFMYGRQEVNDVDKDEVIHRMYVTDRLRLSVGLNYSFMEFFTGSFAVSFTDISLNNNNNALNPPETGAAYIGINLGASIRQSGWDGFFLSQQSFSLGFNYNHLISGTPFFQADFRGVYEQPLVPGFRLNIRTGGVWKSTSNPLFEEGQQKAQVSILPRNYSALHYAGISIGLEKSLFKTSWGMLSIKGSWQAVLSHGLISDFEFNHGPSCEIQFYLSRLALPAIGGGIAYNMNSGLYQFNFSLGMSF